jgi:hypothetical protein
MLVGSAQSMKDGLDRRTGQIIGSRPNAVQGFGLVNVETLLDPGITRQSINQTHTFTSSADPAWAVNYYPVRPDQPVKVTLAWTDAAGEVSATAAPLVNNLDLYVTKFFSFGSLSQPCTIQMPGNNPGANEMSNGYHCLGATINVEPDTRNNTELAMFQPSDGSRFRVQVVPTSITAEATPNDAPGVQPNQDFALYVMNGRTRGDFDADGNTDLILRNTNSGANSFWQMRGTTRVSVVPFQAAVNLAWHIEGVGDFDRDGHDDILYRNDSGALAVWKMNRMTYVSGTVFATLPSTTWRVGGVGDFDGDGKLDIVVRDHGSGATSGKVVVWLMDGTTKRTEVDVETRTDLNWEITGVADMNGDGNEDLVWRDQAGHNEVWQMGYSTGSASTQILHVATLPLNTTADTGWRMAALGDYNHDGYTDICWNHTVNGSVVFWLMKGTMITSTSWAPSETTDWRVVGPR